MATIHDVAALAKVSASTVSHVINGTRFVSPATSAAVMEAIESLCYRPNRMAQALRRRETRTIGLVVPNNSNPFFARLARAIEQAGFAAGYNVILCNSDNSEEREAAYIEVLLAKQVDGLILCPAKDHPETLDEVIGAQLPVVIVDRAGGELQVDRVLSDNEKGGYEAGSYLIQLGHRQMGCIVSQPEARSSVRNRVIGFQRALTEAGYDYAPVEEVCNFSGNGSQAASAEKAMSNLLKHHASITAVFATNDLLAAGAANAVRRGGSRVPDDVSVIGFDNSLEEMLVYPSITTIAQPIAELGRVSVELLLRRIMNPAATVSNVTLPTALIERESCRLITLSPEPAGPG